jgi:hypothetical protein
MAQRFLLVLLLRWLVSLILASIAFGTLAFASEVHLRATTTAGQNVMSSLQSVVRVGNTNHTPSDAQLKKFISRGAFSIQERHVFLTSRTILNVYAPDTSRQLLNDQVSRSLAKQFRDAGISEAYVPPADQLSTTERRTAVTVASIIVTEITARARNHLERGNLSKLADNIAKLELLLDLAQRNTSPPQRNPAYLVDPGTLSNIAASCAKVTRSMSTAWVTGQTIAARNRLDTYKGVCDGFQKAYRDPAQPQIYRALQRRLATLLIDASPLSGSLAEKYRRRARALFEARLGFPLQDADSDVASLNGHLPAQVYLRYVLYSSTDIEAWIYTDAVMEWTRHEQNRHFPKEMALLTRGATTSQEKNFRVMAAAMDQQDLMRVRAILRRYAARLLPLSDDLSMSLSMKRALTVLDRELRARTAPRSLPASFVALVTQAAQAAEGSVPPVPEQYALEYVISAHTLARTAGVEYPGTQAQVSQALQQHLKPLIDSMSAVAATLPPGQPTTGQQGQREILQQGLIFGMNYVSSIRACGFASTMNPLIRRMQAIAFKTGLNLPKAAARCSITMSTASLTLLVNRLNDAMARLNNEFTSCADVFNGFTAKNVY